MDNIKKRANDPKGTLLTAGDTRYAVKDKHGNPSCYLEKIDAERLGLLKANDQYD